MSHKSIELQQLMQRVGISSFRTLSDRTQVSRRAIDQVRGGKAENLKYQDLYKISELLQIEVGAFMQQFSSLNQKFDPVDSDRLQIHPLQQECDRLLIQLSEQQKTIKTELINQTLQQLESLLLQLPTAIYAANQNPSLPARNLVPLLRPLDLLLQSWEIERIGEVGTTIDFDPQWHSLIESDQVEPGQSVVVRYVGYRQMEDQQSKLLFRAKVSAER